MSNLSNGNLERKVKGEFRYRCEQRRARCAYCRGAIDYKAPRNTAWSFEAAHKRSVKTHPHLAYDIRNFQASHSRCNRANQAKPYDSEAKWQQANWG